MKMLFLIICFWLTSCILRGVREYKQKRADAQRSAELKRLTAEWRAQKAEAELETKRLIALEREQIRQRKEQERQAAQLEKHEEQIAKLNQRLALAEREINHYKPMLDALEAEARTLDNKVWYFESKGLPCSGLKKQLAQKKEQAYRMETKVIKAEFERDEIMDKLAS